MAKNSITDYSNTAASNTDIQSVDIDEGCLPSGINNAIREIMADLADVNDGTVSLTSPAFAAASLTGDLSFGDNNKAIFGAGSDLEIYHQSSNGNSIIKEQGGGILSLQSNGSEISFYDTANLANMARFITGGAVQLYHNGSSKFLTTASGANVNGTVAADRVVVSDGLASYISTFENTQESNAGHGLYVETLYNTSSNQVLRLESNGGSNIVANFAGNGDISFYEDTGTTAKLFWDASAERLGLGTTSPDATLQVVASSTNSEYARFSSTDSRHLRFSSFDTASTDAGHDINASSSNGVVTISTAGTERMRIDADGLTVDGLIKFSGLAPTVDYDFNASGSVTSADALAYLSMGSGIATSVNISSVDTITPSWSALSGSTYSDNKFRIMSARGNATDALRIATSLTAEGHGDTTIIGNINVDGVNTRIITGLGITGGDVELLSNDSRRVNIAANGDVSFYEDTGTTAKLFWDASAESLCIGGTNTNEATLEVNGNTTNSKALILTDNLIGRGLEVSLFNENGYDGVGVNYNTRSLVGEHSFSILDNEAMRIDSSGNVGIGTSSPNGVIHAYKNSGSPTILGRFENPSGEAIVEIKSQNDALCILQFADSEDGNVGAVQYSHPENSMRFKTGDAERMRITSAGLVGIGTSLPEEKLTIAGIRNEATLRLKQLESVSDWSNGDDLGAVEFSTADPSGAGSGVKGSLRYQTIGGTGAGTYMSFNVAGTTSGTNDTERMRIDSSGNVLVGKSATDSTTAGVDLRPEGVGVFVRDGNRPLIANRLTNDGDIIDFRKDGTTVGSIGVASGDLNINGGANHSGIRFQATGLYPLENGTASSGEIDLGAEGSKFKNLYLNGGVYLGGTGAANKLDDYEEGTWTPYFSATSGTGTVVYAVQYGYYTKIGDIVYAHGRLQTSSWGTGGSGQLFINGLPFDSVNNTNGYGSMVIGFTNNWVNSPSGGHCPPNQNNISLRKRNGTSAQNDLDTALSGTSGTDVNSVGNDIIFSITYKAS